MLWIARGQGRGAAILLTWCFRVECTNMDSRWTYHGQMAKMVGTCCNIGASRYRITRQADSSKKEVHNDAHLEKRTFAPYNG